MKLSTKGRYAMVALADLALAGKNDLTTLAEIAAHLDERHGFRTAPSTIWRLLDRRGLTFKKNRARQRAAAR